MYSTILYGYFTSMERLKTSSPSFEKNTLFPWKDYSSQPPLQVGMNVTKILAPRFRVEIKNALWVWL